MLFSPPTSSQEDGADAESMPPRSPESVENLRDIESILGHLRVALLLRLRSSPFLSSPFFQNICSFIQNYSKLFKMKRGEASLAERERLRNPCEAPSVATRHHKKAMSTNDPIKRLGRKSVQSYKYQRARRV